MKTPAFAYQLDGPIDIEIDVENGQIFVMNFESLFGTASAHSLDKSFDLFLHGHHLQSDFKLSLKTNIALQVSKVLPQVKFLPFKGEGSFDFTLIKSKGSELSLTIDSDLLGVGWQSPLKNINKSQHETLPTKIYVSDFNNPNIFMSNELFKSQISWLPKNGILATLKASQLDIRLQQDASKFIRIDVINSQLAAGLGSKINKDSKPLLARIKILPPINARFTLKNSTLDNLKFKDLDIYIQKNKNTLRLDNIMVDSNLINIQAPSSSSKAYLAIDLKKDLYKAHGKFTFKDSIEIPWIRDIAKFSYFNSDLSLQWNNLKTIKNLEGGARFLIKDLTVEGSSPSSAVLNLLGVLNLKNIIGKLANLELSLDEYTSTHLDRVEGNLLFTKDRGRLLEPLFVETNAAKMKWAGQINKNRFGQLEDLDLNLDLRIRLNENIPLYAVLLGGLPAVAGSAVIQEIFKEDLDALSSYQFQVKGTIKQPEFSRIN